MEQTIFDQNTTIRALKLISSPVSIPGNSMYVLSFLLGSLLFNSKLLDAGAEGIGVHLQDEGRTVGALDLPVLCFQDLKNVISLHLFQGF